MAYKLNDKVKNLVPYEVEKGRFKVRLDANESYIPLHPAIKKDILSLTGEIAFNRYPDTLAIECCNAFADYYGVDPALVTAGAGSDEWINLILHGLFSHGEKLLITEPDFSMYALNAHLAELDVVRYHKTKDYRIETADLIKLAKRENCRGLIFSNPCNPTSQGLRRISLRTILKELPDVLVILDEAYMDFWDQSLMREITDFDNLIVLRTLSKAMGGAAVRLGFAVCQEKLTKALRSIKSPYNVSSMSQAAGTAVYRHPAIVKEALLAIAAARSVFIEALLKLEAKWAETPYAFHTAPEPKTNFAVLHFEGEGRHKEVYAYLKKKGILVRCFPDFLRVTVGSANENQMFLDELESMV